MAYFGLDKWGYFLKIVKKHGGWWKSYMMLYLTDILKDGDVVGKDKYGNTYYTNDRYFFPTDRWVIYDHVKCGIDYDATMIPPEWYGWMHHKTDFLPKDDKRRKTYPWVLPWVPNQTYSPDAYYPYSTVRPKIHAWIPPKKEE